MRGQRNNLRLGLAEFLSLPKIVRLPFSVIILFENREERYFRLPQLGNVCRSLRRRCHGSQSFDDSGSSDAHKSAGIAKGFFDTYACDRLSRVQIFREDSIGTTFESRCDNESIPESDLGLILDSKCN
jgi:hypothetical protein